jgi:hypothetical protein
MPVPFAHILVFPQHQNSTSGGGGGEGGSEANALASVITEFDKFPVPLLWKRKGIAETAPANKSTNVKKNFFISQ